MLLHYMNGAHYLYNELLKHNYHNMYLNHPFTNGYAFNRIMDQKIKTLNELSWLSDIPKETRLEAILNASGSFIRFNKGLSGYPKYKNSTSKKTVLLPPSAIIKRDRIIFDSLKSIRLCEYGFLPLSDKLKTDGYEIKAIYINAIAGNFYIVIRTNEPTVYINDLKEDKILGVDLGISCFAQLSDGTRYQKYISSTNFQTKIKRIKKTQKNLDRKVVDSKRYNEELLSLQKQYHSLHQTNQYIVRYFVTQIIKKKPSIIVIEDLSKSKMQEDRSISSQLHWIAIHDFKEWLTHQCRKHRIELRMINKYYPSTKLCCRCREINRSQFKNDLNDLKIRTFHCPNCNLIIDRDLNASINISQCPEYTIL